MKLLTPKVRAAIYVLAVALFAVLGVYGLVTKEQSAAWLELVAARGPRHVDRGVAIAQLLDYAGEAPHR